MIAVFSGTTEGQIVVDALVDQHDIVCFNATPYGGSRYKPHKNLIIYDQKLDLQAIKEHLIRHKVTKIVDCTHPYAKVITSNLLEVSSELNISYYRYQRPSVSNQGYDSLEDIVGYLKDKSGNVLLTIGSNQLGEFVKLDLERLYCRVLPTSSVIKKCEDLGFKTYQIIGIQGPFSHNMNAQMIKTYNIKYLVTKESGKIGGFTEKLTAARENDVEVLVLKRPDIKSDVYTDIETLINVLGG